MSDYERIIELTAAYDKRHPDPSKNYGVHGVELRMVLRGELGAVQFVLYTGWLLPETLGVEDDSGQWNTTLGLNYSKALSAYDRGLHPMPVDLGYHSPHPIYDGQEPVSGECEYVDGPCYYDGSGLNAARPFARLLRDGHEGVWEELDDYYRATFQHDALPATASEES